MTGTIAILFSVVVLIVTIYLLVRQYETRTVLFASGFVMAIAALAPLKAFSAFSTAMVTGVLIQNICSSLGFAMVLQLTGCDKHLIYAVVKVLNKIRPLMIPGVVVATFGINIAIPSAAGCAAAVGVVLIPLLISQGVAPALAASAVMMGTFGSVLSPGLMHNPIVAKLAKIEVIEVIRGQTPVALLCMAIAAISLIIVAKALKEDKGYHSDEYEAVDTTFAVNPLLAILPLIPVTLLIIFSMDGVRAAMPWVKSFIVPHAMLVGTFLCIIFTRTNPQKAVKDFCNGMGKGYADVIGIIIAAGVFISGLNALGAIEAFVAFLKKSDSLVNLAATYGPFLLAVVSGSGDAATIAFNESVTSHAQDFGMEVAQMGSLAVMGGGLGRTMSPLAGATIICAGIGKVNPFDIAKRNAPGMIVASVACMIMLTYLW